METLAYDLVADRVVVLVHGDAKPAGEEWTAYVEWIHAKVPLKAGFLVVTPGSAPSSAQRRQLVGVFYSQGRSYRRAAVLTDSLLARGVVTALSWFDGSLEAFSTGAFDGAMDYLEIEEDVRPRVSETALRLADQVGYRGLRTS